MSYRALMQRTRGVSYRALTRIGTANSGRMKRSGSLCRERVFNSTRRAEIDAACREISLRKKTGWSASTIIDGRRWSTDGRNEKSDACAQAARDTRLPAAVRRRPAKPDPCEEEPPTTSKYVNVCYQEQSRQDCSHVYTDADRHSAQRAGVYI